MKLFLFLLVYPFLRILSCLPMRLLYLMSDFTFLIVFYIVDYRKKVVFNNIQLAFPEKSEYEIRGITKKFFKHFNDLIFESIKSFSISEKEIRRRYIYENIDLLNQLHEKGYGIVLTGSHYNNWEWSFGLPLFTKYNCHGAYTRIQNPYFEKIIKSSRTKFGYNGVPTVEFKKMIDKREKSNIQNLYILLSDQSPQLYKTRGWSVFLNNFVPIHTGAETLAKKHNLAVVNMSTAKIKRGYYNSSFELITKEPREFQDFELTKKYLKITEKHIAAQPEFYLWSHKRFKHKNRYKEWLEKYRR